MTDNGVRHERKRSGLDLTKELARLRDRQQLNNGFGAALSRAFEIAVTPVLFGLLGWGLDRWLGTGWVFAAILGTFGVVGMFVRTWYGYDAEMRAHEADQPWNKARREAA